MKRMLFQVLHETFPQHTFLMNGLVQGVKVKPDGRSGRLHVMIGATIRPLSDELGSRDRGSARRRYRADCRIRGVTFFSWRLDLCRASCRSCLLL